MRTPSKLVDNPDQMPVLFEIEVGGATAAASSSSGSGAAAAAEARLSYLLSGPGVSTGWKAVPTVARADWDLVVQNSTEVKDDSGGAGGNSGGDGGVSGSGGGGDFVWALQLEDLEDGEYRLEVCGGVRFAEIGWAEGEGRGRGGREGGWGARSGGSSLLSFMRILFYCVFVFALRSLCVLLTCCLLAVCGAIKIYIRGPMSSREGGAPKLRSTPKSKPKQLE